MAAVQFGVVEKGVGRFYITKSKSWKQSKIYTLL